MKGPEAGPSSPTPLVWRKAAALGGLWASAEIILGSFIHNAHLPLGGHLLTGFGVALMVAGRKLWPEPGLLWRSALVCAAMKSISPSAFIFGPMAAIAAEGFLLEGALRVLGPGAAGCLTGGALAMLWTFLQPFLRQLLFYGTDAALLYARGWQRLASWAGAPGTGIEAPLLAAFAANAAAGVAAAAAGLRVARPEKAGDAVPVLKPILPVPLALPPEDPRDPSPRDALFSLLLHSSLIVMAVVATKRLAMPWLIAAAALYAGWGLARRELVLRRLRRPGLWAGLLGAALLAGLLLGEPGLGLRMGLRALILSVGFACVSEELSRPAAVSFLEKRGAAPLIQTVRLAFRTLPGLLASLPSGREIIGRPLGSLRGLLAQAPSLLDALD